MSADGPATITATIMDTMPVSGRAIMLASVRGACMEPGLCPRADPAHRGIRGSYELRYARASGPLTTRHYLNSAQLGVDWIS